MKRIALVILNCIIILVVAVSVLVYVRTAGQEAAEENRQQFQDTTVILEEVASNYLEDSQAICDMWASVIADRHMTMEEAIDEIGAAAIAEDTSAQLIWQDDLTGLASRGRASDPSNRSLDYSRDGFQGIFDALAEDREISITRRYNDPLTGSYAVAFCNIVTLYDEGDTPRAAILMYVVPVSSLEERWTFPTEYGDTADVALIDADGSYVIKPGSMKNEDFFSYIYSYNRGTVDTDQLKEAMKNNASGAFSANNASGEECYFAYAHLEKNTDWQVVAAIPSEMLSGGGTDWNIPLILLVSLLLILLLDGGYLYRASQQDRENNRRMEAAYSASEKQLQKIRNQSVIINALCGDYLNVFTIDPERDRAEIIKLEGYVTAEITKETKEFSYTDILGNYIRDRVHPEDKAPFLQQFRREHLQSVFAGQEKLTYTYRALIDGRIHYFEGYYVRMSAEGEALRLVAGFRNIDEITKRQQEIHRKQADDLSMIVGLSHEYHSLFIIHTKNYSMGKYRDSTGEATPEALALLEGTSDFRQAAADYIERFVAEEDRERVRKEVSVEHLRANIPENGIYTVDYRRILADGTTEYHQMAFARARTEEGDENWALGFRNTSELVAEQEARQKILEDALNAAQHANRSKTTFLNSMSHDIRTPMNAIIGFTSLAATHIDDKDRVKDYLSKIQVSSNHLLSLINDVLDMSRIESGKVKIEEKEVHLPDVLHDLRTIVQSDIRAKNLDFFIDVMDMTDEDVICDKLRLNQVLLNILSNAMKFTKPGGQVSIRVAQEEDSRSDYAAYVFRIKDTGIGMSQEFIQHIFEPFEREQTATVSGIQGSGLGMAITKNIVDMMGGTIDVVSQLGQGSEFIVKLHFRRSGSRIVAEPIPELEGASALVVDDDMDCCISVCKMLTDIGMRPEWTSSGKEAVVRTRYACEREDAFSVYIIDWLMPDMNGIETVRQIRRIIGEDRPIIILSSYDWSEIETEAREAGVTHFIAKPIFMSELREVLSQPYAAEEQPAEEVTQMDFTGKRILLAEDNELNQEIACEILQEVGFRVDVAEDGAVAVEMMQKAEHGQYDLILMDIQMPIMNGYDATKAIRRMEDPEIAGIPIIAMTANAFDQDRDLAREAGMSGYVPKPINIEKLMETLAGILK